jgi:hypothetical protein
MPVKKRKRPNVFFDVETEHNTGIFLSADQRRITTRRTPAAIFSPSDDARKTFQQKPTPVVDATDDNSHPPDLDFASAFDLAEDDIDNDLPSEVKGKENMRYENSVSNFFFLRLDYGYFLMGIQDRPMKTWISHQNEFLAEFIRHESPSFSTKCPTCSKAWDCTANPMKGGVCSLSAMVKCSECDPCLVECLECSMSRHTRLPFHRTSVRSHPSLPYLTTNLLHPVLDQFILGKSVIVQTLRVLCLPTRPR